MINDDELERLADDFWFNNRDKMFSKADYFIHGFRAAEQMMKDRFPSEMEISREYGRHGMIVDWLKQKLFGGEG